MDVSVHGAIARGLRHRGVTVLTAQEDGTDQLDDPALLDRATALGFVLFTTDTDFLIEGARRQRAGEPFSGIVFAHQQQVPVGRCIDDLEVMGTLLDPPDMMNRVEYLPL